MLIPKPCFQMYLLHRLPVNRAILRLKHQSKGCLVSKGLNNCLKDDNCLLTVENVGIKMLINKNDNMTTILGWFYNLLLCIAFWAGLLLCAAMMRHDATVEGFNTQLFLIKGNNMELEIWVQYIPKWREREINLYCGREIYKADIYLYTYNNWNQLLVIVVLPAELFLIYVQ